MASRKFSLYPGGYGEKYTRFMLDANCTAGAFALRSTATNSAGEVVDATTTAAADLVGVYGETKTYSAVQSNYDGFPADEEDTVGIIGDPFSVYALRASGSATAGTALPTATPANILTNRTADTAGITITANNATTGGVGTVSMTGGLLCGRTGNNVSIKRRANAHTNDTSTTVEVPFPRTIADGDTFIRVPWSLAGQTIQLTSNLAEADATIATGTGAPFIPIEIVFDVVNSEVVVLAVARDTWLNPLS